MDDVLPFSALNHWNRLKLLQQPVEVSSTSSMYFRDQCIHQLIEEQVEKTPDAIALILEDQQLTYRELDSRANQLAHHLQSLGVGPEVQVGLCVERSLALIIGVLGIFKAGGAYVPLDPHYPKERQSFVLNDAHITIILTQSSLQAKIPEHIAEQVRLDTDWEAIACRSAKPPLSNVQAKNLVYVMYTSGSSGMPKGILIPHQALLNHSRAVTKDYNLQAADRVLQFASMSFDVAMEELFPSLISGATCILRSEHTPLSPVPFCQFVERECVTVLNLPTSFWYEWISELQRKGMKLPATLRLMIIGSEKVLPEHLAAWQKLADGRISWINAYGPTEATITSTIYKPALGQEKQANACVPIGHPIDNVHIHVLDAHLHPVPVGTRGELFIGGAGLARGYLHHSALTAERFIPDPFSRKPGARLYRTGDLVRSLADGSIEFIGRVDHQIKLRGFRIELGEIEAIIKQHTLVREAVVTTHGDDTHEKRLIAYIVADQGVHSIANELRHYLEVRIPSYMVPSNFMVLETIPRTPGGKVDYQALPAPDFTRPALSEAFVAPSTETEERLATIWANVLGLDRVGMHDNFFELGGHSLAATRIISQVRDTLRVELLLRQFFESPTIAALARVIEDEQLEKQLQVAPSIQAIPRDTNLPLSFSQERVWLIQQLDFSNVAYTAPAVFRLQGRLDVVVLEKCLSELVRRHEILRTTFPAFLVRPMQVIHPPSAVHVPVIDLQNITEYKREKEAEQLLHDELHKPFDLTQLPLLRWTLLRLKPDDHTLILVEHHLIHDGWSTNVLIRELTEFYKAFIKGHPSPFPEPTIQFADFAYWQRLWMQGATAKTQLAYWREKLANIPLLLNLPIDRPRPAVASFRGAAPRMQLSKNIYRALEAVSRREGVTLFMTLFAAFLALLNRYTRQDDLCVGTGVANRRWRETEDLVGMIINTLVLRTDVSGNPTFRELLGRVREVILDASACQDVPFDMVVEALQPKRDPSYNPLFQVFFGLHDAPMPELDLPGLTVTLLEAPANGSAKMDLSVIVIPRPEGCDGWTSSAGAEGITIIWEYNTDLFDATTIHRMMRHYQVLLEGALENPLCSLSDLPLLTDAERHTLLSEWNATGAPYPQELCIHQLFEVQAEQTPDVTAIIWNNHYLTYQALNERSNRLASQLQTLGIGPEVRVGLFVERSHDMVIGLLAILKAGGAYVPLDPGYPEERLAFMLTDAQISVLLTQQRLLDKVPSCAARVICLDLADATQSEAKDTHPMSDVWSRNIAYVIYTSGSTGRPKGVAIEHRSAVAFLTWAREVFVPEQLTGVLASTSICFDLSIFELLVPLCWGGTVILVENILYLPAGQHITLLNTVPSALAALLREDALPDSVRVLNLAGEPLARSLVQQAYQRANIERVYNLYGPTEDTTYSTYSLVERNGTSVPTIGSPIINTQAYLLDQRLNLVPPGVAGELYLGGEGLARGYLNRPELTAERFIPHPFAQEPGKRLYRTGDVARYRADGKLEYLERLDHQVKLRGYRIELGEIEAVLNQHAGVRDSIVLVREVAPGDKRLMAYVVPQSPGEVTKGDLQNFLKERLPGYMLPSAFICLEALPLTANGKLDRNGLPLPEFSRAEEGAIEAILTNEVESVIATIWKDALHVEKVGAYDNFFDLGGYSLLLVQVRRRLQEVLNRDIDLIALFRYPTIHALAKYVKQDQNGVTSTQYGPEQFSERKTSRNLQRQKRQRYQSRGEQQGVQHE